MRFNIHVFHHLVSPEDDGSSEKLDNILRILNAMTPLVIRLVNDVSNMTSVTESAVTLLQSISAQIRDNIDDTTALTGIADTLETEAAHLAAAVTANTPAAPPPSVAGATAAVQEGGAAHPSTATDTSGAQPDPNAPATGAAGQAQQGTTTTEKVVEKPAS